MELLVKLRARLSLLFGIENKLMSVQQKSAIKKFDFNSVKDLATFYVELCTFPIIDIPKDQSHRQSNKNEQNNINRDAKFLVLSSLVYAMRCLIELDDIRFIKVYWLIIDMFSRGQKKNAFLLNCFYSDNIYFMKIKK